MPSSPDFLTCPGVPELPSPEAMQALARPRRHVWRWLILIVAVLILAASAPLVYGGVRASVAAEQMKRSLETAQMKMASLDLAEAEKALGDARQSLEDVQGGIRAMGPWRYAPWIGAQIRTLDEIGSSAHLTLEAFEQIVADAASIEDTVTSFGATAPLELGVSPTRAFRDLTPEEKRAVLARVAEVLPDVRLAREKLAIALDAWQRVQQQQLYAPLRSALQPLGAQLPGVIARLDTTISLAEVFVPMAGYPKAKNYLVLLQNADELRPTGGFIGNVGVLSVDAGDLKHLQFQDVYDIDGPVLNTWKDVPPEVLQRELGVPAWFLRDSNWSPDFPQSAERILDVYSRERAAAQATSTMPDGVIALEPDLFRDLLSYTGNVAVDGKTFTPENFFTQLEYNVEIGYLGEGTPSRQRKEIVAKVGDALLEQLTSQPSSRWPELLQIVLNAFERKDILIYDREPALLRLLDARHWSGRIQESAPDYLWVVDANLAALKTDGVMDKQIAYQVDARDPDHPVATVTLRYRNTNRQFNWRYTRYRDYVRVYVPEGSELISSEGAMLNDKTKTGGSIVPGKVDVLHDLGKTVFGAFWAIEPGETRELRFTYRLPASVAQDLKEGMYKIFVQKQPGAHTNLTLGISLGKKLLSALPAEEPQEFGNDSYHVSAALDRDQRFEVKF